MLDGADQLLTGAYWREALAAIGNVWKLVLFAALYRRAGKRWRQSSVEVRKTKPVHSSGHQKSVKRSISAINTLVLGDSKRQVKTYFTRVCAICRGSSGLLAYA